MVCAEAVQTAGSHGGWSRAGTESLRNCLTFRDRIVKHRTGYYDTSEKCGYPAEAFVGSIHDDAWLRDAWWHPLRQQYETAAMRTAEAGQSPVVEWGYACTADTTRA